MRTNTHASEQTRLVAELVLIRCQDQPRFATGGGHECGLFLNFVFCFFFSLQDKTRTTLTMEDLSAALAEYGINARKADYYT